MMKIFNAELYNVSKRGEKSEFYKENIYMKSERILWERLFLV